MMAQDRLSEQILDRLSSEQFKVVMRHFSAAMTASFCNAMIFVLSSVGTHVFFAAVTWALVVCLILGLMVIRQLRRHTVPRRDVSNRRRGIHRLLFYSLTLGFAWAALPLLFFADASSGGKLLIACLTSGMLGGGVFVLASVPEAAVAFSGPIAVGALFALLRVGDTQHTLMAVVLTGYSAVLFFGSYNYEKELKTLIATQIASEQKASVSAENLGAMADLATALAHEISQPLSAATAYVQTAERLARMPAQERSLSIELPLQDAMKQLDHVRQMILHLRNAIEGRVSQKEFLHLHKVIREVIGAVDHRREKENIRIDVSLAAKNDVVAANAVQMRQLFMNLISNAFDAMENCKDRTLSISSTAPDENVIRIDVADSGVGVSPAVESKLFEPLMTTKTNGLGVGLSIVHSIVKEHQGQIWTEPNPSGGAVFVLILPVDKDARLTDSVRAV